MMMNYKEELIMTEREYFDAVEKIINKATRRWHDVR